jgi:hypothetical protein
MQTLPRKQGPRGLATNGKGSEGDFDKAAATRRADVLLIPRCSSAAWLFFPHHENQPILRWSAEVQAIAQILQLRCERRRTVVFTVR